MFKGIPSSKHVHRKHYYTDAVTWRPPKQGWYKVNTDGATFDDIKCCGVGVVIKNERGKIMGALS